MHFLVLIAILCVCLSHDFWERKNRFKLFLSPESETLSNEHNNINLCIHVFATIRIIYFIALVASQTNAIRRAWSRAGNSQFSLFEWNALNHNNCLQLLYYLFIEKWSNFFLHSYAGIGCNGWRFNQISGSQWPHRSIDKHFPFNKLIKSKRISIDTFSVLLETVGRPFKQNVVERICRGTQTSIQNEFELCTYWSVCEKLV